MTTDSDDRTIGHWVAVRTIISDDRMIEHCCHDRVIE